MPTIEEGQLAFEFPAGWTVSKYDEWSHYRNQFISVCGGMKAVDVLALAPRAVCWLLEVKDYRVHPRSKLSDLAVELAEKVRDTLAGLVSARVRANDQGEKAAAEQALRSVELRVVLHLELPARPSRLFPRPVSPAAVVQRLRQLMKAIDPHPKVVCMGSMSALPWTVRHQTSPA